MPEDNEKKKKKGPKLFRPGKIPSEKETKGPKLFKPGGNEAGPSKSPTSPKKGPKLFKPSGASPKKVSNDKPPKKSPKLFKPSGKGAKKPLEKKQPKLFKPSGSGEKAQIRQKTPPKSQISKKKPKKSPKLFKTGGSGTKKPAEKKQPKLFKAQPKSKEPSKTQISEKKPKKSPKLFTPGGSGTKKPAEKKQPKLFKAEPKVQEPKKKPPERKPKKTNRKKPKKKAKKKPKVSQAPTSKKDSDKKKNVSAMDLLALTDEEEEVPKGSEKALTSSDIVTEKPQKEKDSGGFSFLRRQLYLEVDVRQMWYNSMFAGLLSCFIMFITVYLISCYADDSFLAEAQLLTAYSHGNSVNEAAGIWTIAYPPVSLFDVLDPVWQESWYFHLAPVLVVAVYIGWQLKNPLYAILANFFFVLWTIFFACVFLFILPIFGIIEPSTID